MKRYLLCLLLTLLPCQLQADVTGRVRLRGDIELDAPFTAATPAEAPVQHAPAPAPAPAPVEWAAPPQVAYEQPQYVVPTYQLPAYQLRYRVRYRPRLQFTWQPTYEPYYQPTFVEPFAPCAPAVFGIPQSACFGQRAPRTRLDVRYRSSW